MTNFDASKLIVSGPVSIGLSWDDVFRNPDIRIHTHWEDSDKIVKSWIAQTSKLDSCLRSRGYGDNLEPYIITGGQLVRLESTADCIVHT